MGTLFEQSPRNWCKRDSSSIVLNEIKLMHDLALKTGKTYGEVLETCKMLEMRRKNDLYVSNGDNFDEQMAGFGKLLKHFNETFRRAFAVNSANSSPSALEAIAMSLGYESHSAIAEAISSIAENIACGIDRYMDNQFND